MEKSLRLIEAKLEKKETYSKIVIAISRLNINDRKR